MFWRFVFVQPNRCSFILNSLAKLLLIPLGFENGAGLLPGGNCCRWFWRCGKTNRQPAIANFSDSRNSKSQFARLQVLMSADFGFVGGYRVDWWSNHAWCCIKRCASPNAFVPHFSGICDKAFSQKSLPLVLVKFVIPPWNFPPNSSSISRLQFPGGLVPAIRDAPKLSEPFSVVDGLAGSWLTPFF